MDPYMSTDEPQEADEGTQAQVAPNEPEAPPKSPNEALAEEITRFLVGASIVAETDYARVESLLATGKATPEDWQRLIEAALYPRTAPPDNAPTDSQA